MSHESCVRVRPFRQQSLLEACSTACCMVCTVACNMGVGVWRRADPYTTQYMCRCAACRVCEVRVRLKVQREEQNGDCVWYRCACPEQQECERGRRRGLRLCLWLWLCVHGCRGSVCPHLLFNHGDVFRS